MMHSRQVLDVMHTSAVAPRSRDPVFDIFFSCVAPVLAESEALVQLVMLDGSFQPPVEIGVVNIDIAELLRDRAADGVGGTTRHETDDDAHRLRRPGRCLGQGTAS